MRIIRATILNFPFKCIQGAVSKLLNPTLHALYQLSSALRVLSKIQMSLKNNNDMPITSDININIKKQISNDLNDFTLESAKAFDVQVVLAGAHLIRSAEICIDQMEVQLSVIRTLSILSEHNECCETIADMSPRLAILLGPILFDLAKHQRDASQSEPVNSTSNKSLGIFNRIGYILGNIMAKSDSARITFYNNDVALDYLLKSLEYYANDQFMIKRQKSGILNDEMPSGDDVNDSQIDTVIDVLIKLIRVVANLSVNADVGYKLANYHQLGSILLTLLNTINKYHVNFVSMESRIDT